MWDCTDLWGWGLQGWGDPTGFISFRRALSGLFPRLLQEGFAVAVDVFQKEEGLLMDQTESPALSQCVASLI